MTSSLLVDTSSLTYRAFFALPTSITDADGHAVNAVRGYLDMVATVIAELQPDEVVHCLDHTEVPEGRLAAFPAYKADRAAPPEEIVWQFGLLRRLLPAMGERMVEAPGWEADDVIGTLAAQAGPDDRVEVLTGDRDLIQLVRDPVVRVRYTLSGTKKVALYDEAGVHDKYGIAPQRYVDFAILRGDPSDGLPGVKGVGPKTAIRLLRDHADLASVVAAADQQTPKLAATLRDSADYIDAMLDVVPVRTDVELHDLPVDADRAAVAELAAAHAIESPVQRYTEARQ